MRLMQTNFLKGFLIWGGVTAALLLGVWGMAKLAQAPTSGTASAITERDITRGPKDAKVVLIEYSDFQCPACANFFPHVEEVAKELEGKILFVYRHFPLPQHGNANITAYASEAAGKQGKFFEMYSLLFEKQSEWEEAGNIEELIAGYAKAIGLDAARFSADMKSDEVKEKVEADLRSGRAAKVNSTPTFFLNGEKLSGYQTYDEFKNLIREAVRTNS